MIKTYQLTTPARNSSIVLRGKTGNAMRYNFSGGDPMTNKPASIVLRSQYAQDLLESSDMMAKGYVRLARATEGGETAPKPAESMVRPDITSPEQVLEFVATKLEKVYKQPKAALMYAEQQGFKFPNLNIE